MESVNLAILVGLEFSVVAIYVIVSQSYEAYPKAWENVSRTAGKAAFRLSDERYHRWIDSVIGVGGWWVRVRGDE